MNYSFVKSKLKNETVDLLAVSKSRSKKQILELYKHGQRKFGENRVQELCDKYIALPKDIEWHMIGRLQSNKVKYIISFVSMIHSVDNAKLIEKINLLAQRTNRTVDVLLQIKIALENTKSGWVFQDLYNYISNVNFSTLSNIRFRGVMAMATFTNQKDIVRNEFRLLRSYFDQLATFMNNTTFDTISMGMSNDYEIAIEEGANLVRIGSLLFTNQKESYDP